jgi:large subunit ribosomal protein L33
MADNRIIVHLKCTECKNKNYTTTRNRKNSKGKLELKKFCPTCGKHTLHKESK